MTAAWAASVLALAVGQLVTSGRMADVGVTAIWIGLFALIGWAAAVVPIVGRFGSTACVSGLRWSWLTWGRFGRVVSTILLTPVLGTDAFLILWYPAAMGAVAGLIFAFLVRKRKAT